MLYVGLESADLAIQRVEEIVSKGEHGIPEDVVRKRYIQSLTNLKNSAPLCNNVMIYDNTHNFVPIYERHGKDILINPNKNIKWFG